MKKLDVKDLPLPDKGYIVLDASLLICTANLLRGPLRQQDESAAGDVTAILNFLSKNGFQVIIPAASALSVGILDERYTSREFFPSSLTKTNSSHEKWLQGAWKGGDGRIQKEGYQISVVTSPAPQNTIGYYNALEGILDNYLRHKSTVAKTKSHSPAQETRRGINDLNHKRARPNAYDAMVTVVNALPKNIPVFVLSNRRDALKEVNEHCSREGDECPVNLLNLKGLIYALRDDVIQAFGVADRKQYADLLTQNYIENLKISKYPATLDIMDSGIYREDVTQQNHPFRNIMEKISFQFLEEPTARNDAQASGRLAKFTSKYGNWQERTGLTQGKGRETTP